MIFAYFIVFQNIHIVEQSLYNNTNIKQLFGHSHNVWSTSMSTCILKAHHNLRIALICNKMENGKKTYCRKNSKIKYQNIQFHQHLSVLIVWIVVMCYDILDQHCLALC